MFSVLRLAVGGAFLLVWSQTAQAALITYTVSADVFVVTGADSLGLDGSSFSLAFTFDDQATRTYTNNVNWDGFGGGGPGTLTTWSGTAGGLNDGTFGSVSPSYVAVEYDTGAGSVIMFGSFPDGPGLSLSLSAGSVGDATTGPANVFDPLAGQFAIGQIFHQPLQGDYTIYSLSNPSQTLTRAAPVPEPATLLLFGTGLSAVAARRRLKKRA